MAAITVLYKEPKNICVRKVITNNLLCVQELVEGHFERVPLGRNLVLFCNKSAVLQNRPLNVPLGDDQICGNLVVCREDYGQEGDELKGISDIAYDYYARIFNSTMFNPP